ncbi:flagellar hook assembly protein FlgD [Hydrogenophaga defluvii]|uniref:Basal-body rod modification protein FlgD n=1 Tax=Hydrogenophaga defluvii TaxID=249410 RepID=A0ABW2SCF3_9BURK
MFMAPLSNTQIESFNAAGGTQASNSDPQAAQDRFLKLMVAQLANQDPLNPMDNAELTSQMAQINTVSGIQQLNATLSGMSTQFNALQALQSTSLIGKLAVVNGSQLGYTEEGMARGGLLLSKAADSVKVEIMGTDGKVMATVDMGGLAAGQHNFEWDASKADRSKIASFRVTATQGGEAVTASPLSMLRVASVGMVDGAIRLRTDNGTAFAYSDVLAFQ